jgi:hypothetical protein
MRNLGEIMSTPSSPEESQQVQISLRDMGLKYLGAVQRCFDIACATIGALRCQTERDYDEFSRSARFMPSQQQRLEFDAVRPAAESWLLKQLLADAMGLMSPLLEDVRSVAELAKWKASGSADQTRVQRILGEDRQAFLRLQLEEKLARLKGDLGIEAPNAAFLPGYLKLGAALIRGGTVAQADATEGNQLAVRLAVVDLQGVGAEGAGGVTGRMVEVEKKFAVGQRVEFRKEEVLCLFASIAVFVTGLLGSLQAFVQQTLPEAVDQN